MARSTSRISPGDIFTFTRNPKNKFSLADEVHCEISRFIFNLRILWEDERTKYENDSSVREKCKAFSYSGNCRWKDFNCEVSLAFGDFLHGSAELAHFPLKLIFVATENFPPVVKYISRSISISRGHLSQILYREKVEEYQLFRIEFLYKRNSCHTAQASIVSLLTKSQSKNLINLPSFDFFHVEFSSEMIWKWSKVIFNVAHASDWQAAE